MAAIEVVLPKVDMDMESGVIAAWKVADGDVVSEGDIIFEMETSKSMMEVEAPGSGVIRDLASITGEQVPVGTTVAWIHPEGDSGSADAAPPKSAAAPAAQADAPAVAPTHDASRLEPFTATRRLMAERLSDSARNAPHFYLTMQVEMTGLQAALAAMAGAGSPSAPSPAAPSLTVAIAWIASRILLKHPRINASIDGDAVRLHNGVHIGIAIDREGDLLVPVLRQAHARSLSELAADFARLRAAVTARSVAPADLRGSTFSISNLGMYGVDAFTAIINPPESAILAVGRAADAAVVRDGNIVVRSMASLSLSCDHRVIDGAMAARFMADLRAAIEGPPPLI